MELKQCPFCGSILKWCEGYCGYVHASDAECFLAGIGVLEEVLALWNTRASDSLLNEMATALEKLSRLGNEPYLGNSVGNLIAQAALQKYHEYSTANATAGSRVDLASS